MPATVNPILAIAATPDDEFAAFNRGDRLFVVDLRTQRQTAELLDPTLKSTAAHEDVIRSLAFSPSGDLLASGGLRAVKLWRRPTHRQVAEITASEAVLCQAASADHRLLAQGLASGRIELRPLDSAAVTDTNAMRVLTGHESAVTGLAFAPGGVMLYSVSVDKTVRAWDCASGARAAN